MLPKAPPGLIKKKTSIFVRFTRNISYLLNSVRRAFIVQIFLSLLIIAGTLGMLSNSSFERIENLVLDTYFVLRTPPPIHPAVVYVEIAEDGLQAIGRWPWPRHYHAAITHILESWGAKGILFDMTLTDPSDDFNDGALEEALSQSKHVYLPTILERSGTNKKWIYSQDRFIQYSQGTGHINITPDADGTMRRIHPTLSYGGETHPFVALEMAYDYLGKEDIDYREELAEYLDEDGDLFVNWAGTWENAFGHYSYWDVIRSYEAVQNGRKPLINPNIFKDKICLIGLTGTGQSDIKATPMEAIYPAIGIHANIINGVLTDRFIRPSSGPTNAFNFILFGILATACFSPFRNKFSPVAMVVLCTAWLAYSFYMFSKHGIWMHVAQPLVLILNLFVFSMLYTLFLAHREKLHLFKLATRDDLTGLYLLRHFKIVLADAIVQSRSKKQPLSLIMLDIDHFKSINDRYGHQAGDYILKAVAKHIKSCMRLSFPNHGDECAARYGGEEFIIMLPNTHITKATFFVAEKLRELIGQEVYDWHGAKINVTASLGISMLHEDQDSMDTLIQRADSALYVAKEKGRNQVRLERSLA